LQKTSLSTIYLEDVIVQLTTKEAIKRLGCTSRGPGEVKLHKFFRGVNWTLVESKAVPAPWIPKIDVNANKSDSSCWQPVPDETNQ